MERAVHRRSLVLAALALSCTSATRATATSASPTILTLQGHLLRHQGGTPPTYHLSEAELLALPTRHITTSTPWTPRRIFAGPALADVLSYVRAQPGTLNLQALNDYRVSIPWHDMAHYGVILAHSADGQRMVRKDFGPLWLIYPRDQYPDELDGPAARAKSIWQVQTIEVQ